VPSGAASTFVPQASSSAQTPGITADPTKVSVALYVLLLRVLMIGLTAGAYGFSHCMFS
jgi:hypothetical protein